MEPTQKPRVTGRTRDVVIGLDRTILSLARHWLLFLNLAIFLYVGLPVMAPVFMQAGLPGPARAIYGLYSGLCHQLGYRSWYLFGERNVYPRDIFEDYTGIDTDSPQGLFESRAFIGNEQMGWKLANCERDVAIYGAMLVFGLVFIIPGVRQRLKPLGWLPYILIGILPIALDGFSQLFSQLPPELNIYGFHPFAWLPYRESTPFLRTLTGALFGLANAWLAYPYLRNAAREMEVEVEGKLERAGVLTD